jgi:hypothetical protein
MRAGFITPSRFKDVMTVARGYKTKPELEAELLELKAMQAERERKGSTKTQVYIDTEARIKVLPNLISNWKPESRFGDTALTYAKEVALGRFGVIKPEFQASATEHGKRFEPVARAAYEEATGYVFPAENFRLTSDVYPFIAGECDGNIYGRGVKWGGEIKCPKNPINQLNTLAIAAIKDNPEKYEALRKYYKEESKDQHDKDYLWQVAGYCAPWMYGWEGYTFISYDPDFPGNGKLFYKDYERNTELESELESTLVMFETKVVQPLVIEFAELFGVEVPEGWN